MRTLTVYGLIFAIALLALASIGTIIWSLDADSFYAIDERLDLSDVVLTSIILVLAAVFPTKKIY